jgi:hypothetical protein
MPCPCSESDPAGDDSRWFVLANFAFHSACNGFMWMDYSTVSEQASEAIDVKLADINTLYSVSFMAAVPSIVCAMCFLDRHDWVTMLVGTSSTVLCAWLRFAAVWQSSYVLALSSSAALGMGVSIVFTGFAKIPATWFSPGPERAIASAIAVQSNFFGWALGGVLVPALVGSPHSLRALCFTQALVVSLCWLAFFMFHRDKPDLIQRLNSAVRVSTEEVGDEMKIQQIATDKKIRRGSFAEIVADEQTRKAAFGYMSNCKYAMQGLGCALLQAVGFTIPGVQEEIFGAEGYSAKTCSWTGFAFIISGVIMGMSLGKFAPSGTAAAYKLVLALFWSCAFAASSLQAVYWYGDDLSSLARYWTYLPLMGVVGASSLGFLNLHLPVVCGTAEPVSEALSGGLVELVGQVLGSVLTTLSTGRQFWVCALASIVAAIFISVAPPSEREASGQEAD